VFAKRFLKSRGFVKVDPQRKASRPIEKWNDQRVYLRADLSTDGARAAREAQRSWGAVVVREPPAWYDEKEDHSPWIKALAEVRLRATREGWCYHHVQAIIVAIEASSAH
jgi:hypothetical protein